MSDEWGPWIEHDSKGCPVPKGTVVHVVDDVDGGSAIGIAGVDIIESWYLGVRGKPGVRYGSLYEITRYRIRKPRGIKQLEELLTTPERELEEC